MLQLASGRASSQAALSPCIVVFPTRFGWVAGHWEGDSLLRLTVGHPSRAAACGAMEAKTAARADVAQASSLQQELHKRIAAVLAGEVDDLSDVELDLSHLRPFARRVIERCRRIPRGQTLSYAQLAAECGSPAAARAVGNAMATNRHPIIVPCHRVVGSRGALGGFSAPSGIELKRQLLEMEGALA